MAAAVGIEREHNLEYSPAFRNLVTIAAGEPDNGEPLTFEMSKVEQAAATVVSEAVRMALANNDMEALPRIIGLGVSWSMRFAVRDGS